LTEPDEGRTIGCVSAGAVQDGSRGTALKLAIDPFGRLSRNTGLLLVLGVVAAGLLVARLGVRFDGFLDLHSAHQRVPLGTALADQFVAVPVSAAVAWLVARPFRAKPDLVDLLIAIGVARIPTVVGAPIIVLLTPDPARLAELVANPTAPSPLLLLIAAIAIPIVAWHITLLVFGLRHAMALSGGRLAAAVVGVIIAAEIASKLVLMVL
jgi:hypothetical protein